METITQSPLKRSYKDLKWALTDDKFMQYDIFGTALAGAFYVFVFNLLAYPFWITYRTYNKIRVYILEARIKRILRK